MRYNRLMDLGLTEQQIKDNLILTSAKVGRHHDHLHRQEGCEGHGSASSRRTCRS